MTSSGPEGIRGGNSYRSLEEEVPGESAALRESMTFRGGSASSRQLTRKVRINKCADLTLLPLSDLLGSSLTKPNQKPGEAFTWFIKASLGGGAEKGGGTGHLLWDLRLHLPSRYSFCLHSRDLVLLTIKG